MGNRITVRGYDFPHRALAAFWAISLRLTGESLAALAFPPFFPPCRPNSIAARFLPAFGSGGAACPVLTSTMNFASWFVSRGRLPLPIVTTRFSQNLSVWQKAVDFKL
jgi:hypothetical protein